ncbi:hypothetical protein E4T39_03911 [Aureobasidium subglaciale]|nr:hypothetical protein E4T39_03911 [Aureobasidium subglaciale]
MHSLLSLLALSSVAAALTTTSSMVCNADLCLRSIRATNTPGRPAQGKADCSSFLRVTVTPATYTSTSTVTVESVSVTTTTSTTTSTATTTQMLYSVFGGSVITPAPGATVQKRDLRIASPSTVSDKIVAALPISNLEKRQQTVRPSAIPAYASPCSGAVRYSSACSCVGATATTITAATPTTVSITTTTTISVSTSTASATTTTTITVQTTSTVCAPPSYGFNYDGGYTSAGPGQGVIGATYPSFPNIQDQQGCCAKCFETPNCFIYYLGGGTCTLYVLNAAPIASGSDQCPAGVAAEYTHSGNTFGLGACAVYTGAS